MRFRIGAVIGFAAGYYLGAKAGRERYEQLRGIIDRIGAVRKVQAAVDLASERLRGGETASQPLDAVVPPSPN